MLILVMLVMLMLRPETDPLISVIVKVMLVMVMVMVCGRHIGDCDCVLNNFYGDGVLCGSIVMMHQHLCLLTSCHSLNKSQPSLTLSRVTFPSSPPL